VVKNIAPTTLAVMRRAAGLPDGRLHPGRDGVLLAGYRAAAQHAILQRDIPLLQGTIFVLAMFFVGLNLLVDMLQPLL
jgi:peptide/nickel transport system permease protein